MKKKMRIRVAAAVVSFVLATGCGSGKEQSDQASNTLPPALGKEPIVLTFFNHAASVSTDEEMNELLLKPIRSQYPNITFKRVTGTLDKMLAAGDLPDLIGTSNVWIQEMVAMGVATDLKPFIQRDRLDLTTLEPGALEVMNKFSSAGELYALPFAMNYGATAYNKDIFDKFGVPYPKDNMTWGDMIELAKRVTRIENSVQYVGLDMGSPHDLTRSYSLAAVDANQKALLTGDGYKKVFELFARLYAIPDIIDPKGKYKYNVKGFYEEQILAMYPYWLTNHTSRIHTLNQTGKSFNWDVAAWPSFDDKPGIGRQFDFHVLMIPPSSKNKEAAYRVLKALVGKEAQVAMNRGTRLTVLQDPALKKEFAGDLNIYGGKNLEGVFKAKPAPYEIASPYDAAINTIMDETMKNVATKGLDVNTALRTANESANKEIEALRQK
jgi:multiple sugar transport system substrate-binding protein